MPADPPRVKERGVAKSRESSTCTVGRVVGPNIWYLFLDNLEWQVYLH